MSTCTTEVYELTSGRAEPPTEPHLTPEQQLSYRKRDISVNVVGVREHLLKDLAMYSLEANPENFPDGGWEAYTVLVGAFFGLIADFGIPNGMGAIEAYVSRNQLAHLKPSTVSWIFSLHLGTMYFGGVFFGNLFDKYGSKKLLTSGAVLMFVGLMCTAELKELYQFILSFGILTALGTSLAMAPLIGVLSHWFLKKRAMACSTATVGGLIGSSVFAVMLQKLYKLVGYKWGIRVLAFICLACMSVSIILVKERKEDSSFQTEDEPVVVETRQKNGATIISARPASMDDADRATISTSQERRGWKDYIKEIPSHLAPLRDVRFVSLTIAVFLSEIGFMTILTYLTSFALAGGVSELKSYLLLTILNVSGIPARLITGFLADQLGRFNVMLVTSIISTGFIWGLLGPSNGHLSLLYAFTVLYGVLSSAVISLIAACLGQICPALQFGKHYGVMYFCLAFLTLLGVFSASLVIGTGSEHDYKMWIVFEGCITTASIFAWIWARWCNVKFRVCKF